MKNEDYALRQTIFLTGATGLLGQYLLIDLLSKSCQVAVLARDSRQDRAEERIAKIIALWGERLEKNIPTPVVIAGDLCQKGLGLTTADHNWVGRNCSTVIHSAASVSFRSNAEGDPWRTNVEGTRSLLEICQKLGLSEWHQISTAFVCGRQAGLLTERELIPKPSFHNPYEESKWHAEQLARQTRGIQATIYRPSVIVGDSRTGYTTSFNGLYHFLEMAVRLAEVHGGLGRTRLPLRLPLCGNEQWNLVPVDWVSQAIVTLLGRRHWHGCTFHLVSQSPLTTSFIRDVGESVLNLPGVEFIGKTIVGQPTRIEQVFMEAIQEYWPYLDGNPVFDSANTQKALSDLPPPILNHAMLERLIHFGVASRWGRTLHVRKKTPESPHPGCAYFMEHVFPVRVKKSGIAAEAGLDLTVSVDLHGPGGGKWSLKWSQGELVLVTRGILDGVTIIYHTDTMTFRDITSGIKSPQEAFFEQRISITGDVETALKLAVLFGEFLSETNPGGVTDYSALES